MNKIINTKAIIVSLVFLVAVAAAVFYFAPQVVNAAGSCGSCEGGGGGEGPGGGGEGRGGSYKDAAPRCDFLTASPTSLPHNGGNVTLNWGTTGENRTVTLTTVSGSTNVAHDGSTTVFVNQSTNFTLRVSNSGGSDSCTVQVTVQPAPPAVGKCEALTASRTTVPNGGANVVINWDTTNTTAVFITNIGNVAADGSHTVFVSKTTTFTLTAAGVGGNDTCAVTVTVEPPAAKPAKCDSLTASRNSVPSTGANVTLTWATTNASSVSINNGVGTVAADGSKTVFVDKTTTFTLTAVGAAGNDSCTVTVTKNPPVTKAAVCDFLTANRTSLPHNGGNVTLNWGTTNATSVSINNGVGTVSADGSRTVFVDDTTTFTLTANGTGGNDNCSVTIVVDGQGPAPRCDFFTISDNNVEEGDEVTLEWGTTNADSVSINNGIGNVSNDGSRRVTINDDTTFTLTARGTDNQQSTCTVSVEVEEEDNDNEPRPRCELDISDRQVKKGEKVTLEWETSNAESVRIRDDHGNTLLDTRNDRYFDGELDVVVNRDTEFTLTVRGEESGSDTCKVEVEVDDIAVYEKRNQDLVIALTQVPYTGFEAGPTLTFIFYAMLTLWALFIAYILVIKKGSILGFALYKQEAMTETDLENRKKVEALVAKYTGLNRN